VAITLVDGTYVFEGFHHGTLTITPAESEEYIFEPVSRAMAVNFFENVLDANFTAVEKEEPPPLEPEAMQIIPGMFRSF
jgi:hypothetical protein